MGPPAPAGEEKIGDSLFLIRVSLLIMLIHLDIVMACMDNWNWKLDDI